MTLGEIPVAAVSVVRPFPARVVRPEWARRRSPPVRARPTTPASTSTGVARSTPRRTTSAGVALYVYRQSHGDGVPHRRRVRRRGAGLRRRPGARARGRVRPAGRGPGLAPHDDDAPPALVTLLHRAGPEFTRTIEEVQQTPPILDFAGPRGLQQTVWRRGRGPATAALVEELARGGLLHRRRPPPGRGPARGVAAGRQARRRRPAGRRPPDGRAAALRLPPPGVRDPSTPRPCSDLLAPDFEVRAVAGQPTPRPGSIGLYVDGRWYDVTYLADRPAGAAGLDVAILQTRVLDRLAGDRRDRARPGPPSIELTRRCDVDGARSSPSRRPSSRR